MLAAKVRRAFREKKAVLTLWCCISKAALGSGSSPKGSSCGNPDSVVRYDGG